MKHLKVVSREHAAKPAVIEPALLLVNGASRKVVKADPG
jgi:hypothetical protein